MTQQIDAIILGAGAAGLFCGLHAARRGLRVLVLDHAAKPAEKIRISGGGRCNFTNLHTTADNFLSDNPHFAKSALARYTQWDFISEVSDAGIAWHEKTLGQLFCDGRSTEIIDLLVGGLRAAGGDLKLSSPVRDLAHADGHFRVDTETASYTAPSLVIATGGLSIPKIGATPFGYEVAERFGHALIPTRPALVPFTFAEPEKSRFAALAGVSAPCTARAGRGPGFVEAMLFTHRGLSGPAMLQASSYWQPGTHVTIDLSAGEALNDALKTARGAHPRRSLGGWLSDRLPQRLVQAVCDWADLPGSAKLADLSNASIAQIADALTRFHVSPAGTEGYRTAEVTAGGVDTAGLSSQTLQSQHVPGLYFIGEVVDVTGWLGGYNFQWAWSSAWACAQAL